MIDFHRKDCFYVLSICSILVLICPMTLRSFFFTISMVPILIGVYFFYRKRQVNKKCLRIYEHRYCQVASVIITAYLLNAFVFRWTNTEKVKMLSQIFHISQEIIVITIGIIISVGSIFLIYEILSYYLSERFFSIAQEYFCSVKYEDKEKISERMKYSERIFILLCAVIVITICSKSSPIYPFNNWDDANSFFTVGKGIFNAKVPYRDLLEQKGPLLYFLYGLAYLISRDTFLGVYLLEIVATYIYLLYSYRISSILLKNKHLIIVPVTALLTCTTYAYEQGGSAEEICLPMIAFSLWVMLKPFAGKSLSWFELFCLGIVAGCVFWIKFTLIGVYIGWYIWLIWDYAHRGFGKRLLNTACLIAGGVILSTIPWIVYFGINNSIREWLEVYFYNNLFIYTQGSLNVNFIDNIPVFGKLMHGLMNFQEYNLVTFLICLIFFSVMYAHRYERISQLMIFTMVGAFFFIYIGGQRYRYYSLIMDLFIAPGLAFLFIPLLNRITEINYVKVLIFSTMACFICFFATPNIIFMRYKKEDLAQFRFRDIIINNSENPTILNYDFIDGGFYTVCNIVPNCKAFHKLNMPLNEQKELQDFYVKNGLCDYVITRSDVGNEDSHKLEKYVCVAECDAPYGRLKKTYRLYKLKD